MSFLANHKPAIRFIALGLVAFVVFTLANAPASLLTNNLQKHAPLSFSGVSGSLWKGRADQLMVQQIPIGSLQWSLQTLKLFIGQFDVQLQIESPQLQLDSQAAYSLFSGNLNLGQTQFDSDLRWLLNHFALPLSVNGRIKLDLESLTLENLTDAQGTLLLPVSHGSLNWNGASIDYPEFFELGNFSARIESQPEQLTLNLLDGGQALQARGHIQLQADGQYRADITLTALAPLPNSLTAALNFIARPDGENSYRIEQQGNVQQFGMFF